MTFGFDTRPIDWVMLVVEFLVLSLIAYEVVTNIVRDRRISRRQSAVNERLLALTEFMKKGQELQGSIPMPQKGDLTAILAWTISVQKWSEEVQTYLTQYSARAAAAFALIVSSHEVDSIVRDSKGFTFPIGGGIREAYQRLVSQLNNLRGIMEKPEVYF
jgi:hypothetical protein